VLCKHVDTAAVHARKRLVFTRYRLLYYNGTAHVERTIEKGVKQASPFELSRLDQPPVPVVSISLAPGSPSHL
jgi:hypothetical protein